jgi:hypothetical protein
VPLNFQIVTVVKIVRRNVNKRLITFQYLSAIYRGSITVSLSYYFEILPDIIEIWSVKVMEFLLAADH